MDDFTPQKIEDADTTYRVPGARAADLKARALAAYFPPHEIRFKPQMVKNNRCLALGYITARAVMDRLDYAVGADNWQTQYENLDKGSVRCTLLIRFENGGEWISKSDVGSPSEQPDEGDQLKAAHSDALKRAAVHFGVGRYLYALPQTWVDYDPQRRQIVTPPAIPVGCLPTAYRPCGAERGRKLMGMLESCLNQIAYPREQYRAVALQLIGDYGYKEAADVPLILNRHADEISKRLNVWVAEIARGNPNCPESPLYDPQAKPARQQANQQAKETPQADKPAPQRQDDDFPDGEEITPANPPANRPPVNSGKGKPAPAGKK